MDLNFGHRFIPRIGSQNYEAVDRCLGRTACSTRRSSFRGRSSRRPGLKRIKTSASLREQGTRILLDDSGWRGCPTPGPVA